MSTALSFKSESGDYYTYLTIETNIVKVIEGVMERYGEEFPYLELISSDTEDFDSTDMRDLEEFLYEAMEDY